MKYKCCLLMISIGLTCSASFSQVWQWSIEVRGGTDRAGPARAFLWVPADCKKIKAVIISQNNMEEQSILENTKFREEMSKLGFAEIWVSPSFDHLFNFKEGAGEVFNGIMNDLANESGYHELRFAPIVPMGHSAAASWPYYFAAWNPGRTLACISVSGQWPYFRDPVFAPDIWENKNIDHIPSLETMGEYEAANTWSAEGLKERQQHPLMPLSMLACPAEGHFAATQKKIDFIAFYIRKATRYRLVEEATSDKPAVLKPVDPAKTGWLADKWRLDQIPTADTAPIEKYKGDKAQAFWFFDEETAKATEKYQSDYRNKKAELLGYVQENKVMPQRNTHQQVDLKFIPLADGISFKLAAAFLDAVPGASPRTTAWTGLPTGSPIGHASSQNAISIDRISGPFEKLNDSVFSLKLEKGLGAYLRFYQLMFAATHQGDALYKPAVQQAQMNILLVNVEGAEQHIDFPEIPDQKGRTKTIQLHAVSDANVQVHYFVREGSVILEGNSIRITKIPPRSRFPVKVTVVAWQYGRSIEPKLKTAVPVARTFYILK